MLYQMQKTLSLYFNTCPRVFKIREGTITLLNLSTQKCSEGLGTLLGPGRCEMQWITLLWELWWNIKKDGRWKGLSTLNFVSPSGLGASRAARPSSCPGCSAAPWPPSRAIAGRTTPPPASASASSMIWRKDAQSFAKPLPKGQQLNPDIKISSKDLKILEWPGLVRRFGRSRTAGPDVYTCLLSLTSPGFWMERLPNSIFIVYSLGIFIAYSLAVYL